MNCKNCGAPLNAGDAFCQNCGTPVENQQPVNNAQPIVNEQAVNPFQPNVNNEQPINNVQPTVTNEQPINNVQPAVANEQPVVNNQPIFNATQPVNNPQPVVNNTQPANQPMMNNYNPMGAQDNSKKILIIIGCVILVAIVVLIIVLLTSGGKKDGGAGNNNGGVNDNKTVAKANTHSVVFGGYKFAVSDDYVTQTDSDFLYIGDSADTWLIRVEVFKGDFNKGKKNTALLKTNLIKAGYTVDKVEVKTVDGFEYLIAEVGSNGSKALIGYGKIDATNMFAITCFSVSGDYDYSLLSYFVPIAKSATSSSTSYSISANNNISLKNTFDIEEETTE